MKIASQQATLHATLGDCIYVVFRSGIRADFEYSSAQWRSKNKKGTGNELNTFLSQLSNPFGPHKKKILIRSGEIFETSSKRQHICIKNLKFEFV